MIGPEQTCATPEPYESPPSLSLGRKILSPSERSHILIAHDLSLTHKKFRSPSIAQMWPKHQQPTSNMNSFNNNNPFNNIANFIPEIGDEGRQILQWLSPLEPQQRHQGVQADRLDGVGNWVLETSAFRKWRDAEDGCVEPVLFCYGNPGVGKTYVRWEGL